VKSPADGLSCFANCDGHVSFRDYLLCFGLGFVLPIGGTSMGTLVYICPSSGEEVATGIELDLATFVRLRRESVRYLHCQLHQLGSLAAWIDHTDDDLPDKAA
jgi:hypothetical protein